MPIHMGLEQARARWQATGSDVRVFDEAAEAVESAICVSDVRVVLEPRGFQVVNYPWTSEFWEVRKGGAIVLRFSLTELDEKSARVVVH